MESQLPPPLSPPPLPGPAEATPSATSGPSSKFEFPQSVLERAKKNQRDAIEIMFRQFIGTDEQIHFCEYMGQSGLLFNVTHSFACVTHKRIVGIEVGSFGKMIYQDAGLEDLNSGLIYQPSIFGLYVSCFLTVFFTLGLGIIFLPFVIKGYYRLNKCGLVGVIREGLTVYIFTNRNRLVRANAMWRTCLELRDKRVKQMK